MSNDVKYIIAQGLCYFYYLLTFAIFIRCLLSWFPIGNGNVIIRILNAVTEPILGPIRRLVNKSPIGGFMIDFSPIIAFIILQIIFQILINILVAI